MEANGQRIGDSHKVSFTIRLHVVLLAADVDHHLLGLRRIDAEVGTTLLVNLRELVAGDGILYGNGIGRYINFLNGHRHVGRTLGLKAEVTSNGFTIAATQLAIAGGVEV